MEKIKRRGENYTIPQIDLSVEPKNTKEELTDYIGDCKITN